MSSFESLPFRIDADAREARFAARITTRLNEAANDLPADTVERLRFAREQALARARLRIAPAETVRMGRAAALLGAWGLPWWPRAAAWLPLFALVGGLAFIQYEHEQAQITTAVEIDSALLTDDAPLEAYSDAGFVEFLKSPRS